MQRVRAVIIENKNILLIKRVKPVEIYWVFPGGAVEAGETNQSALQRECLEELGVSVEVGYFFCKLTSNKPETIGQEEYFYVCQISGGVIGSGKGPEFQTQKNYVGDYIIEWVPLLEIAKLDVRPREVVERL